MTSQQRKPRTRRLGGLAFLTLCFGVWTLIAAFQAHWSEATFALVIALAYQHAFDIEMEKSA